MTFKIIIVGGGIAGLATGHAIERAKIDGKLQGVDVTVYEKAKVESDFQKYPIWLAAEGRKPLQDILSPEENSRLLSLTDHGITHGGITICTPGLKRLFGVKRYEGKTPFAIHRWILKGILEENVKVIRGQRTVQVTQKDVGESKVEVVFEDGRKEIADLVIGADGLGSTIRSQIYPEVSRFPLLPYITIQFKILTTAAELGLLDYTGMTTITGTKAYSVLLMPLKGKAIPPLPLSAKHANPFIDPSETASTMKALEDPMAGYVFCAVSIKSFPQWEDMTPNSWLEKITGLLEADKADERLIKAMKEDVVPQTLGAWQVVCCDDKQLLEWKGGRVILLGDAAHAMPPQGGAGGATSLRDAETLVETLIKAKELGGDGGSLDSLLPKWHDEMLSRGYGYMKDARRRLYLSNKEGWRVVWQRALLRIMDFIWPFAYWVLSRGQVAARNSAGREIEE